MLRCETIDESCRLSVLHSFYQSPSALRLLVKVSLCLVFANEIRPGTIRSDASDCLHEKLVSFLNARVSAPCGCSSRLFVLHASARRTVQKRTHPAIAIDTAHCAKKFHSARNAPKNRRLSHLCTGGRGGAPRRLCVCKPALHGWERRVLGPGTAARELTACANTNRTQWATSASAA